MVCLDDDVAFDLELFFIGEHLREDERTVGGCATTYLVLAAGTFSKVLALYSAVVPQFYVGCDDREEVGKGVSTCVAVDADADALARECEGGDDDPVRAGWWCACESVAVGGKSLYVDLDLFAELKRCVRVLRRCCVVAEQCANVVPENVVVRVGLNVVDTPFLDVLDVLERWAGSRGHRRESAEKRRPHCSRNQVYEPGTQRVVGFVRPPSDGRRPVTPHT